MELHGKEEQFDEKHMRYNFISQSITCLYIFAEFAMVVLTVHLSDCIENKPM